MKIVTSIVGAVALLGLSACATRIVPVTIITANGETLRGSGNAGHFNVSNEKTSCGVTVSGTAAVAMRCEDGRSGAGEIHDLSDLSLVKGPLRMADGSTSLFFFGDPPRDLSLNRAAGEQRGAVRESSKTVAIGAAMELSAAERSEPPAYIKYGPRGMSLRGFLCGASIGPCPLN